LNITPPSGTTTNDFYLQLSNAFQSDISMANQLAVGFENAVVQQLGGERPYTTLYDPYYGDVTQQGIAVDKLAAINSVTQLHEYADTEDVNQGQGLYFVPFSLNGGTQDPAYQNVAELAAQNMAGAGFAIYPTLVYIATANFAATTHSVAFPGRTELRDWIGGYVFTRLQDFLDFTTNLAVENNAWGCTSLQSCGWNPTQPQPGLFYCASGTCTSSPNYTNYSSSINEFVGPDGRYYMWAYIPDRNTWILVDRDRNPVAYSIVKTYTTDVVQAMDDGTGLTYAYEMPVRVILDYFTDSNYANAATGE